MRVYYLTILIFLNYFYVNNKKKSISIASQISGFGEENKREDGKSEFQITEMRKRRLKFQKSKSYLD